jgi:hypothetical protein
MTASANNTLRGHTRGMKQGDRFLVITLRKTPGAVSAVEPASLAYAVITPAGDISISEQEPLSAMESASVALSVYSALDRLMATKTETNETN